ncbi:hypothetical protein [Larkinella punicea]|uniref:TonB-dependent receptor n=1 Tax=Larkinella punicea TaxID=2315727 RepID=A0A368JD21_9BACT|nr:hypothetical protein [Larkinella punicea]RCR65568.1 hypothetical protein DUE52_31375 [Larkinella punicea]
MGSWVRLGQRKITAQLTYFRENTDRAYQIARQLQPLTYARLKAVDFPKGQQPVLSPEPARIDTFMAAYDTPVANLIIQNQGVEFTIEVAELKPLRTSFNLNGAWIRTVSRSTEPFLDANRAVFSDQTQNRIPIYTPTSTASGRFNTSLRVIHRIPALQLVASALIQTIWSERNRYLQYDSLAIGYSTKAGQTVWLTPEQSLETAHQSLRRGVNPVSLNWQDRPPVWLLNLRLTKEWKAASGFAFYVNNVLANKPLYDNNVSRVRQLRDHPSLFFGVEVFYAL